MPVDSNKAMKQALALARRGMGNTHPNPPVGAVLVKDGKIVGAGWHQAAGGDHAEVMAIRGASHTQGADLYVTLEPCAHEGKTGPCTQAILDAGIKRVFIARRDPNPVSLSGVEALESQGVEVHELTDPHTARMAAHLLAGFESAVGRKRPRIALKLATSLDGRIASGQGDSRWISSEVARAWVHRRREEADAVLIGAGTATKDNPALTARVARGKRFTGGADRQPARVVVDSRLRVSPKSRVFAENGAQRIVITTEGAPAKAEAALHERGVKVWRAAMDANGRVSLKDAVRKLGDAGYTNLLCEGGGELSGSLIREQLADVLWLFVSPEILLGSNGPSWTDGLEVPSVPRAVKIARATIRPMGGNWMITAVPEYAMWTDPETVGVVQHKPQPARTE